MLVYVDVLRADIVQPQYQVILAHQTNLSARLLDYEHIIERKIQYLNQAYDAGMIEIERDLFHLKSWTDEHRSEIREHLMQYATTAHMTAAQSFDLLAAQRWLDRTIAHSQRLAKVLAESETATVALHDVGKNAK
jgi:phosphate:Na+ symporter